MPDDPIETLDDWNVQLACCCQMPACPLIEKECQEIAFSVVSSGFYNAESEDLSWRLWARYGSKFTWVENSSVTIPADGGAPEYVISSIVVDAESFSGSAYTNLFTGGVGGGEDCPSYTPDILPVCTSTGTSTVSSFVLLSANTDAETIGYAVKPANVAVYTVADISGTETDEHLAWQAAEDAWIALHPTGPTRLEVMATHDAWEAATLAHEEWVTARDEWVAEDPENNLPEDYTVEEPPAAGAEPENMGEEAIEPEEFYPECTFRMTLTNTEYHWTYYSYLHDPPGLVETAPPTVTVTVDSPNYGVITSWPGFSGAGTYTESPLDYEDPQGYDAWIASTRAVLLPGTVFPSDGCISADPECFSFFDVTDEPEPAEVLPPEEGEPPTPQTPATGNLTLQGSNVRFRWRVPSLIIYRADPDLPVDPDSPPVPDDGFPDPPPDADTDPDPVDWWRGNYMKVTWQQCFFPKEWDAWKILWDEYLGLKAIYDAWVTAGSVVPELPALPPVNPTHPGPQPIPPTLGTDQTDEWTGPGDPNDDATWLFPGGYHELGVPAANGQNRIVNTRWYCYPDSPYGFRPQITGEGYEPFTIPDIDP